MFSLHVQPFGIGLVRFQQIEHACLAVSSSGKVEWGLGSVEVEILGKNVLQ